MGINASPIVPSIETLVDLNTSIFIRVNVVIIAMNTNMKKPVRPTGPIVSGLLKNSNEYRPIAAAHHTDSTSVKRNGN